MHWRMRQRQQPAYRASAWKYLKVDDRQCLFDTRADARECANLAYREPARLAAMRQAWLARDRTILPIPVDARVRLGDSAKDVPQRWADQALVRAMADRRGSFGRVRTTWPIRTRGGRR